MNTGHLNINGIPAMIFGDNSNKVYIYVHGKSGYKEDAEAFAKIVSGQGFQVLSFDLPEHGERKNDAAKLVPWEAVPEFHSILFYAKQHWQMVSLYASSIGAYFSLLAFSNESFKQCLFVSPILDMTALIEKMMCWANVSEERLKAEKKIPTDFGETLSWEYYTYAKNNPVTALKSKTAILYAGHDNMTDRATVTAFTDKFKCSLQIHEKGEHWFHTKDQLTVWRDWVEGALEK